MSDDLIRRKDVLDVFEQHWHLIDIMVAIKALPSVQPERCEDCVNFSKTRLLIPQPEIIRCKDCRYFNLNHFENVRGIPLIVAHEICNRWGNGCKTDSNGFCFMGERGEANE